MLSLMWMDRRMAFTCAEMPGFLFTYSVLTFIVLRFCVTLFNFLSNPKLGKYGKHYTSRVSVVIQAAGSSTSPLPLLHSLRDQDYQHIEVILEHSGKQAVDPEVKTFCEQDSRFSCRHKTGTGNPEGMAPTGDYLLFLDSRTLIRKGFINSLIYRASVFDLTLLSIFPTSSFSGFKNRCFVPLDSFLLLNLVPLRLIRLISSPVFAAGSNECMFFDADTYRNQRWGQRASNRMPEATEMMKVVKQEGYRVEALLGNKLIYNSVPAHADHLLADTSGLLFRKFGNSIAAWSIYVALVIAGPVFMLLKYEYALLILPAGLIFLTRIMISFLSAQSPVWNVVLHPLQMLALFLSYLRAACRMALSERLTEKEI